MIGASLIATGLRAETLASASPPRAAIFAGGYGGGHNVPAATMKAELMAKIPGIQVEIFYAEDYILAADVVPRVSRLSTTLFTTIYQRVPRLWDHIYEQTIDSARDKLSAGDIPNPFFSTARILADLRRFEPDVIFSTFHIMTSKLIGLRDEGLLNREIPIAWLDTDFVNEDFYALHSRGIDLTFLGHPALETERVALGVPADKMVTTGLFVDQFARQPFTTAEKSAFLRGALGVPDRAGDPVIWVNGRGQEVTRPAVTLDPSVRTVVISSGRAGVGDYPAIIRGLVSEARARGQKIQIVAVCGENVKAFDAVTRLYDWPLAATRGLTLVASRLVDHAKLLRLVRSADLFVGKPGSLSSLEAATMGVPRVLVDIVGGQERWGAEFFERHGLAEVVKADAQGTVGRRGFALLENEDRLKRMREADEVVRASYDLTPVTAFFIDAVARREAKPAVTPSVADDPAYACESWLKRAARRLRRVR